MEFIFSQPGVRRAQGPSLQIQWSPVGSRHRQMTRVKRVHLYIYQDWHTKTRDWLSPISLAFEANP